MKPHYKLNLDGSRIACDRSSGNQIAKMRPQDIKAKIVQAGATQAAIATSLGVTAGCMSQVISGKRQAAQPAH